MYEYHRLEGIDYPLFLFKTQNNHSFQVSFTPYPDTINGYPVFDITVDCLTYTEGNSIVKDLRVGETVCKIIESFLGENNESILFFICEESDNKQTCRIRKFNAWYILYSTGNYNYSRFNIESMQENGDTYFSSLIYDPSIHFEDNVVQTVREKVNEINSLKNRS